MTELARAELERFRPFDDIADDPGYFISVCCFAPGAVKWYLARRLATEALDLIGEGELADTRNRLRAVLDGVR